MPDTIYGFTGANYFLSNFAPFPARYDGVEYPTAEHAFAAAKTLDLKVREIIAMSATPGQAKRRGRNCLLREDWDALGDNPEWAYKYTAMTQIVRSKFSMNTALAEWLRDTNDMKLIEANHWHDTHWGVCTCATHDGMGDNRLGNILMGVRDSRYLGRTRSVFS